jgi:hypothetical protein
MKTKAEKKEWIVRMRCTVTKDVCVGPCTEEEARESPWEHSTDETEVGQEDWEVLKIEENE